ncbi:hypothetical protein SAMN05443633_11643 [Chryseobacterium arachidis]|uniref:Uncharacterized protein n=1 Tax=Chryseobacterium arachidis TaxID=1416778 RepID=A0A1M5K6Y8_9FLAO|nr:hypothetical protein [Chryseobacterium arachidis]SHG48568.1 hypothetical protein SAMN05443633_11643 [Chryseobacterium arachidis]
MKDFDLEKLERRNIYKVPDNLFENIQGRVLSGMNDFDLEKLERKNIYTIPENLFETVQENVMNKVLPAKKAPIFKLNWAYAAAASLALIFGATFVFNNGDVNEEAQHTFAVNNNEPKTESQIAYETLQSDLTSVENNNQTVSNQRNKEAFLTKIDRAEKAENDASKTVKPVSTQKEVQMNEYLDNFSNSEIAELASNSTQDVYLDLYN